MRTMSAGEARRALAAMATENESSSSSGLVVWLKRILALAPVLALLTLVWGWAMGWFTTPAEVLAVRATINQQIAELDKVGKGQVPYDNRPSMGAVFGSMRDLPEGMRDQVRRDIGRLMEANERAQVDSFFTMPAAQRQAELDRRIKVEDDRRKQFMADRAQRAADRGQQSDRKGAPQGLAGGGPGGGGPGGPGGGGGRGGPGGGGGGGGGPRGGGTDESRRKSRLDNTDPAWRSRQTEYRRQIDERRQQTGGGGGRR